MTDVERLKKIRELCYDSIREQDDPPTVIVQIAHLAQGHLVRIGAVDGVAVGNGEFNINGRDLLS